MTKALSYSEIQIWGETYINYPESRQDQDRKKRIIQCEPGVNGMYIVEVADDYEDLEDG